MSKRSDDMKTFMAWYVLFGERKNFSGVLDVSKYRFPSFYEFACENPVLVDKFISTFEISYDLHTDALFEMQDYTDTDNDEINIMIINPLNVTSEGVIELSKLEDAVSEKSKAEYKANQETE